MFTKRFLFLTALGIPLAFLILMEALSVTVLLSYNLILLGFWLADRSLASATDPLHLVVQTDEAEAFLQREFPLQLRLENRSKSALYGGVSFVAPQEFSRLVLEENVTLPPGAVWSRNLQLLPLKRGDSRLLPMYLRQAGPFRLAFRRSVKDPDRTIPIFPRVRFTPEEDRLILGRKGSLVGEHRRRHFLQGREFESLRPYTYGDPFRVIDWKATAKQQRPIVREFQSEMHQIVMVSVDLGRQMSIEQKAKSNLDWALEAAFLLATTVHHEGDLVGFFAFDSEPRIFLPPGKGRAHMRKLLELTKGLESSEEESDYRLAFTALAQELGRRALVVTFTDVDDTGTSEELIKGLHHLSHKHLAMLASLRELDVEARATAFPEEIQNVFQSATAVRLLREREHTRRVLSSFGVRCAALTPGKAVVEVINQYLEIKRAGYL